MPHKEIEVKFEITPQEYQHIYQTLAQELTPDLFTQNDFICKLKNDENLRMRCQNKEVLLTHKKKIYRPDGTFLYCQESECPLDKAHQNEVQTILQTLKVSMPDTLNPSEFWEILKNQLTPDAQFFVHLHKQRTEFKQGELTYVLDQVENLGCFLEIEQLVPLNDTTDETILRQNLKAKLTRLNLTDRDTIQQGYSVLMHQKQQTLNTAL